MRWPWEKREMRSAPIVTTQYIDARRSNALYGGGVNLSATIATAAGIWSRAFAMLIPEPSHSLTADHLAAIGLDLFFRANPYTR